MSLMRYKIYFLFLACNVLFGSIPALYTVDDPILYEEWKTASYERVAEEVAPVIIERYGKILENKGEVSSDEEDEPWRKEDRGGSYSGKKEDKPINTLEQFKEN